jgi:hypothetical protein
MRRGGTTFHITAFMAAVLGVLCLPCLLAPFLISAGFSAVLLVMGTWFVPVLLALIGVSIIGFFLSYRRHKKPLPLLLAIASAAIVYDSGYIAYNQGLTYVVVAALLGAIGVDLWVRRQAECAGCTIDRSSIALKKKGILE